MRTWFARLVVAGTLVLGLTGPNAAVGLNVFETELGQLARTRLLEIARSDAVVDAVREQNRTTAELSDARIAELDGEWAAEAAGRETGGETGGETGPLIAETMGRPVSLYLRQVQERSEGLFTEIILMDARGLNVGISEVTSDYWQGDEDKWQKTFLAGPHSLHIGALEEDLSTRTVQSQVSLPVVDPDTGEVIGALTFGIDVEEL
ncbi:hypothetical protein [Stappia indica]|uniref:Cache domain-containing protein n=1 Tax=Stappia indica TaxID=538381 RepID=A0A857C604_9HYPH|nr:hypothetical protein [Stappia indica]QGZ34373.1 hypothetical protein GH266_07555 [Stappia indica]